MLGSLTEVLAGQRPFLWLISCGPRSFTPTEMDIDALTRPIEEDEYLRGVSPADCRDWALENWAKIIPDGKEILRGWAKEKNDGEFLEAIERLERRSKSVRKGK